VRAIIPELRRKGAELVVIGSGQPWHAAAFREDLGLAEPPFDVPVLVDPALAAFRAAALGRGLAKVLTLGTARSALRAFRAGFRQQGVQGDPWQNGGVVVVRPDGSVPWSYASRAAGDHPPLADIVAAVSAD